MNAVTAYGGTAITDKSENVDEFIQAAEDHDSKEALIQDGTRFALGTILGIGGLKGGSKLGSKNTGGNTPNGTIKSDISEANTVSPAKRNTGETVLGSYPEYVKLSDDLNARRFEIPVKQWKEMTPVQQWTANQKFLDRTINRGDSISLSNSAHGAKPGTYFYREVKYIQSKGYTIADDGMSFFPPKSK
jgi:hypothetical protein